MTLKISNLSKVFGEYTAVDNLSLEIPEGKIFGMLGGNGAGKTTTFRMILGLLNPTEGDVTFEGKVANKLDTKRIGYLPEERGLHTKLTVEQEIIFLARLKGMRKPEIRKALDYWLTQFNIPNYKNTVIDTLSKGNQQKIQFITAIIHSPDLLILDEPFSGLDPVNVNLLKKVILELKKNGTTIIFSSHQMGHVEELCDEVCILNKGEKIISGNISSIKQSYERKEIYIQGNYNFDFINNIEGVVSVTKVGNGIRIYLSEEKYAENVFSEVIQLGFLDKFMIIDPSLNDIFIQVMEEDK